jgi:glycosyltransferase involved in cell wall biosynthesis
MAAASSSVPEGGSTGRALRIAMIGRAGLPAACAGVETAVEEIGRRLVDRGHAVTLYCNGRGAAPGAPTNRIHLGMRVVQLPTVAPAAVEAFTHTAMSVAHTVSGTRPDAAFVFNPVNAPFVPLLRRFGIPTTVHVDGLEWERERWNGARGYNRWAEYRAARSADALIADAPGIADYYRAEYSVPTELIGYGTHLLHDPPTTRLAELGLERQGYHLVVACFAPENRVDVIIDGYLRSTAALPLVVVGSARTSSGLTRRIAALAADPRVRLLDGVREQDQLDQLFAHSVSYLHGHAFGGTNPSLVRAMGARTAAIAWDSRFNREVLGVYGAYFRDADTLAALIEDAELSPHHTEEVSAALQRRAATLYNWAHVTDGYEDLAQRLVSGYSTSGASPGRRAHTAEAEVRTLRSPSATARGLQ